MSRRIGLIIVFMIVIFGFVISPQLEESTNPFSAQSGDSSGSGIESSPQEPSHDNKHLNISVVMKPESFRTLHKLSEKYSLSHPDITLQLVNVDPEQAYEQFKSASALGSAPDIMLLDNRWVSEFAALGYLQPMDEKFFAAELQAKRMDQLSSQVKWNGYIWGIPKDIDPYVLVWNKGNLEPWNAEHPPSNAEQLLAMNKAIDAEKGATGIYFDPGDPGAFLALVLALTDGRLNGADDPGSPVGQEATIKLLEALLFPHTENKSGELQQENDKGQAESKAKSGNGSERSETETKGAGSSTIAERFPFPDNLWKPWDKLQAGEITMMVTTYSDYSRHKTDSIQMTAIPRHLRSPGSLLSGTSYSISANSAYPQEAFDWIREMTKEEAETDLAGDGTALPVTLLDYNTSLFFGEYQRYDQILSPIRQWGTIAMQPEFLAKMEKLEEFIRQLWRGEIGLEQFAAKLQEQWGQVLTLPPAAAAN